MNPLRYATQLLILPIVLLSTAYAQAPHTIRRPDLGIAFTVPAGYESTPTKQQGKQFTFFNGIKHNGTDGISNLLVAYYSGPLSKSSPSPTPDQVLAMLADTMHHGAPDFHADNKRVTHISGMKAFMVSGTCTMLNPNTGERVEFRRWACLLARPDANFAFILAAPSKHFTTSNKEFQQTISHINWLPHKAK